MGRPGLNDVSAHQSDWSCDTQTERVTPTDPWNNIRDLCLEDHSHRNNWDTEQNLKIPRPQDLRLKWKLKLPIRWAWWLDCIYLCTCTYIQYAKPLYTQTLQRDAQQKRFHKVMHSTGLMRYQLTEPEVGAGEKLPTFQHPSSKYSF